MRVTALALLMLTTTAAQADDRRFEVGGGTSFDLLASYDVAEGLGRPATGNDLGPGTLGFFGYGGFWITDALVVGIEGELAIGGLVRTDEHYFGSRSNVGSTLTVSSKLLAGARVLERGWVSGRVGGELGAARMSEATGEGSVHLDAIVAGPWIGVDLGRHVMVQLSGDLHVPVRAEISNQVHGDPSGVFLSGGVRVVYVVGLGHRRPAR
ncbi:MAG: hypothetical protein IPQ07_40460 [Myxococcales bacterium]|nr:hypothetical protein [Myxococcales bacterium]